MRYLLIFALFCAIVAPASCREHRKFRKHKNPDVRVTRRDIAARQIMDDSTRRDEDEVLRTGQYFQDIFAEHLEPLKIQFGHVCEDPHEWEQRFERKDLKNNRHQGKAENVAEMDKDIAACEAMLGKEPEISSKEKNNVILSNSITERLQTGNVDGDRLDNYDNYWMNKLACIDESHSAGHNLDIEEAEEKLRSLAEYAESGFKQDSNAYEMPDKDRVRKKYRRRR